MGCESGVGVSSIWGRVGEGAFPAGVLVARSVSILLAVAGGSCSELGRLVEWSFARKVREVCANGVFTSGASSSAEAEERAEEVRELGRVS